MYKGNWTIFNNSFVFKVQKWLITYIYRYLKVIYMYVWKKKEKKDTLYYWSAHFYCEFSWVGCSVVRFEV